MSLQTFGTLPGMDMPAHMLVEVHTTEEALKAVADGKVREQFRQAFSLKKGDKFQITAVGYQKYRNKNESDPEKAITWGIAVGVRVTRNGVQLEDKAISLTTFLEALPESATAINGIRSADILKVATFLEDAKKIANPVLRWDNHTNEEYVNNIMKPLDGKTITVEEALRHTCDVIDQNGKQWPIGHRYFVFTAA